MTELMSTIATSHFEIFSLTWDLHFPLTQISACETFKTSSICCSSNERNEQQDYIHNKRIPQCTKMRICIHHQWRGGSEAAGEAARLMAPPPQSYFFCLLVWDAYHVVGATCNDRRSLHNTFEWMRALQALSSSMVESWWGSPPGSSKESASYGT